MEEDKKLDYKVLYEQECRKVKQLQNQLDLERIKFKKILSNKNKNTKLCPKCLGDSGHQIIFNIKAEKEGLKNFSNTVNDKLKKISDKEKIQTSQTQSLKNQKGFVGLGLHNSYDLNQLENVKSKVQFSPFSMIQNFSIFGLSEQTIKSSLSNNTNARYESQILHSHADISDIDHQTGSFVFPFGISAKKITGLKAKDRAIEMISSCYTNKKSFVIRFRCQSNINQSDFEKNSFLNHINPEKKLFCICMGIEDYTYLNQEQNSNKNIQEENLKTQNQVKANKPQSQKSVQSQSVSSSSINTKKINIIVSHRVFCISSYYPFFSFFEEILRRLINIIKMERLTIYKHNDENIAETDSRFQLQKMIELFHNCLLDLNSKQVLFNKSYELRLINHEKIILITDWNLAKTYFIEDWAFTILSNFNADLLLEILSLIIFEDKAVFVCFNSHILTYTIYLFTHVLLKPFIYAHEVVSIIHQEEFLGVPSPVVYGFLRKRQYLEQYKIMEQYPNTYIFINPNKVEIVYTDDPNDRKDQSDLKPQKLKKQLNALFKQLKKSRKTESKSYTKIQPSVTDYLYSSTIEERDISVQIVEKVHQFMLQEVFNKLPNQMQINHLKNSIDYHSDEKDEYSVLIQKAQDFVRKTPLKEAFTQKFLKTQIFNNFICK